MVRSPEFRVVAPRTKPAAYKRKPKPRPLSFAIKHVTFGDGLLVALRVGESGVYIADIDFAGTKRTMRVEEKFFITPVSDILASAPHFPTPAPPRVAEKKVKADKRETEEVEIEHEELNVEERAALEDDDGSSDDADEQETYEQIPA
jgi:hypothetical protein